MVGPSISHDHNVVTPGSPLFGLRSGFIAVLLLLASFQPLAAQEKLLPVFRFQRVNGIFSDHIRSRVVRDEEGFAWVGTLNGLERFDGYNVKDYRNVRDDPYSLSSNYIPALLVDKKQRLWVETYDTGLVIRSRCYVAFGHFQHSKSEAIGVLSS
jgi:ligand-binding sensor domain-containing protein